MPSSLWAWALAGLLGAAFAARGDSWVIDGEARGAVKEKSTVWSLSIEAPVVETISAGTNGIPTSGAVTGYVQGVAGPLRAGLTVVDGRLERAEIDLLNNYLFDAMAHAVGSYPLAWGFADSFADEAFVMNGNWTYNADNELYWTAAVGGTVAGAVHQYNLDETSGSVAEDVAGAEDGTLRDFDSGGTDDFAEYTGVGIVGNALTIGDRASNAGVVVWPAFDELVSGGGSFSISLWFIEDVTDLNSDYFAGGYDTSGSGCYFLFGRQGNPTWIGWNIGGGGTGDRYVGGTFVYETEEWVHAVLVYDSVADEFVTYLNGEWQASAANNLDLASFTWTTEGMGFGLGSVRGPDGTWTSGQATLHGQIDNVVFFDTALDKTTVSGLFNDGEGTQGSGGETPDVFELSTLNRVWATTADGAYVSLHVEAPGVDMTNVLVAVSNTDPARWTPLPFALEAVLSGDLLAYSGATNLPTADTNLVVRVQVTNGIAGVKLHGIGYGRR